MYLSTHFVSGSVVRASDDVSNDLSCLLFGGYFQSVCFRTLPGHTVVVVHADVTQVEERDDGLLGAGRDEVHWNWNWLRVVWRKIEGAAFLFLARAALLLIPSDHLL